MGGGEGVMRRGVGGGFRRDEWKVGGSVSSTNEWMNEEDARGGAWGVGR